MFFDGCIHEAWELFKFTDKEDEMDSVSLEAFMIEAIIRAINPDPNKQSKKKYRVDMRRRDISLLSFGLLDGYHYISSEGCYSLASDRHKEYLQNNRDFIAIDQFDSLLPDSYNVDDCLRKAKATISKDDERCREIIAKYLTITKNYQKCFEEGIKNHIKEIKHEDGSIEQQIVLPPPCFTLENFPPNNNIEQEPDPPIIKRLFTIVAQFIKRRWNDKKTLQVSIVLLAMAVITLCIIKNNSSTSDSRNTTAPANQTDEGGSDYQPNDTYLLKETITEEEYPDGLIKTVTEREYSLVEGTLPNPPINEKDEAANSFTGHTIDFLEWLNNLFKEGK